MHTNYTDMFTAISKHSLFTLSLLADTLAKAMYANSAWSYFWKEFATCIIPVSLKNIVKIHLKKFPRYLDLADCWCCNKLTETVIMCVWSLCWRKWSVRNKASTCIVIVLKMFWILQNVNSLFIPAATYYNDTSLPIDHIHGGSRLPVPWPQQSAQQLSKGHEETDGWLSEEEERGATTLPSGETSQC